MIFLYVRTAHVARPLELFQYCCMCILLVIVRWHEEEIATESQILALKSGGVCYDMSEEATSLCFKVGTNYLICKRCPESH